jgi:hypothetical protein
LHRWTPLLFGVAGLIIGVGVPLLDEAAAAGGGGAHADTRGQSSAASRCNRLATRMGLAPASWGWVLACISAFVVQYYASAVLQGLLLGQTIVGGVPTLDAVLAAYALCVWLVFDATPQGAAMALLTAICGPAIEVALISQLHLYAYAHGAWFGAVPLWIPWVYACGGPAVGNLGRLVWRQLKAEL